MPDPNNPTSVRQGRLGRQILVILVVSMALAIISGWVLWGVFFAASDQEAAITSQSSWMMVDGNVQTVSAPEQTN